MKLNENRKVDAFANIATLANLANIANRTFQNVGERVVCVKRERVNVFSRI